MLVNRVVEHLSGIDVIIGRDLLIFNEPTEPRFDAESWSSSVGNVNTVDSVTCVLSNWTISTEEARLSGDDWGRQLKYGAGLFDIQMIINYSVPTAIG